MEGWRSRPPEEELPSALSADGRWSGFLVLWPKKHNNYVIVIDEGRAW